MEAAATHGSRLRPARARFHPTGKQEVTTLIRKTLGLLLASALLSAAVGFAAPPAAPPHGKGRFSGSHPLSGQPNAGYCYIDVPHVHDYVPDRPALYQQNGDSYVFTGDPVPFGYDGTKTVFYGHHPVPIEVDADAANPTATFCFLKGPHYHDYPQPEGPGLAFANAA